jgi:hypothetical protein
MMDKVSRRDMLRTTGVVLGGASFSALTRGGDPLLRQDGYYVLDADYFMETGDKVQIHVRNRGLWHSTTDDWPADYAITTPEFEVQMGRYDWLNQHSFTGTVAPGNTATPSVRLAIYKLV